MQSIQDGCLDRHPHTDVEMVFIPDPRNFAHRTILQLYAQEWTTVRTKIALWLAKGGLAQGESFRYLQTNESATSRENMQSRYSSTSDVPSYLRFSSGSLSSGCQVSMSQSPRAVGFTVGPGTDRTHEFLVQNNVNAMIED